MAQSTPLMVVSHYKGALGSMKMSELKSVFKGERQRWNDGTKVSIVLMKTTTPVGQSTCEKIYNMSGDKVKRFWLGLSFSGKADPPKFCDSITELETFVAQNPGAIGIVDKVSAEVNLKTIMIDGKNSF